MLKETKDIFSDKILHQAIKLFGGTKEKCEDLGGFEAFVYELQIDNKFYILKITHTIRRSVDYVMGELEFVNYLAQHGVPTSKAVPSVLNNYIETIEASDGGQFLAYMFVKAEGALSTFDNWTDDFLQTWGQLAGMMNRLSKEFRPSTQNRTRQVWSTDDLFSFEKHLPESKRKTIDNANKLIKTIKSFPIDKDTYGLVHADLHHGNFFHNNNVITPFDFDDCGYDYFANDIAMPLYYALPHSYIKREYGKTNEEFGENFLFHFLKGYRTENQIRNEWVQKIPYFLKLRSVLLFIIFHQIWVGETLDEKQAEIIERLRSHIDGDIKFLDIDYSKFC